MLAAGAAVAQPRTNSGDASCRADSNHSGQHEMRFTVQEVDGRSVLVGAGAIDANLIPRLRAAVDSALPITELQLHSSGGSSRVAREAALMIRQGGLPTRIPAGSVCAEACAFMFMGGIMRSVDPGGHLMIRRGAEASRSDGATVVGGSERAAIASVTAIEVSDEDQFLTRTGVSRSLLTEVIRRPATAPDSSAPYCLSPEELDRYNVTTRVIVVPEQVGDPEKK